MLYSESWVQAAHILLAWILSKKSAAYTCVNTVYSFLISLEVCVFQNKINFSNILPYCLYHKKWLSKTLRQFEYHVKYNGTPTCQEVRHGVQRRWPHGSMRMSLSFSAQILHNWNVEPISQYNSYCSCVTLMWSSGVGWTAQDRSGFTLRPSGNR